LKFKGPIAATVARVLYLWFEIFDRLLGARVRIRGDSAGLSLSLERPSNRIGSIDERIEKLDVAREHLADALLAIDDLKNTAKDSKIELAELQNRFTVLEEQKASAESKLEEIQIVTRSDIEAFRTLAGIPNVRRERFIGFVSGLVASLIATAIIFLSKYGWGYFFGGDA
jgi:chromosome segregation ATPase